MLIKSADDKSERVALLEDLQKSPGLPRHQLQWLQDELLRLKRGLQGERDAAHYLDNYLKDDPDRVLLHDLRFQIDGDVVQIDHLMITRGIHVYLLETKCFSGNVQINDHGEWTVTYPGGRAYGIESPLEQSRRHEGPMRKLLDRLGIVGRAGTRPRVHHCVLLHPKAVIHRPDARAFDTEDVIKADQFPRWHQRKIDQNSTAGVFFDATLNMRSAATLREFALKLVRQHKPADLRAIPEFVIQRDVVVEKPVDATVPSEHAADSAAPRRKLACAKCNVKLTFAEGKFCWNNERRFGGLQYCRVHQGEF